MNNKSEGYKMVATSGNLNMFAKDQDIRSVVGGQAVLNVPKGVFVAVNVDTGKSIDGTQVATTPRIKMGVSNGKNIRYLPGVFGMAAKNMEGVAVSSPKTAVNEIKDYWFKCTSCDERKEGVVEVIDEDTINVLGDMDNGILYPFDATLDCGGCEPDCNPSATCDQLLPEIISQLNAQAAKAIERKFYVTAVYAKDSFWCFEVDKDGVLATPITDFTIGGVTTNLSAPATNQDDLARVKAEIEAYMAANDINGSVTVIGTHRMSKSGKPYILVNTDETDFAMTGHAACDTGDPRTGHTADECAFRIIGTLPQLDCECQISRVLNYKPRHISFRNVKGFSDLTENIIQESEVAQNFGAELKILEYKQEIGGEGRPTHHSNTFNDTNFALSPDPVSRLSAYSDGLVDCNKDYYKFHLNYKIPYRSNKGFGNVENGISPNAYIAVPKDDATTFADVKTFVNALAAVAGIAAVDEAGTVLEQVRGENL